MTDPPDSRPEPNEDPFEGGRHVNADDPSVQAPVNADHPATERDRVRWLVPGLEQALIDPADTISPDCGRRWADQLRAHGVKTIWLIHGSFVGNDVVGVLRALSRWTPGIADYLQDLSKTILDAHLGSLGNFDESIRRLIDTALNGPGDIPGGRPGNDSTSRIDVKLFRWSGENNHIGRFDAAIRWLQAVLSPPDVGAKADTVTASFNQIQSTDDGRNRHLVLAHSHGGNVLALATQLLAASPERRIEWFKQIRSTYRLPILGRIDQPAWGWAADYFAGQQEHVRCDIADGDTANAIPMDIVTMGTPTRYRFENFDGRLIHMINHHVVDRDDPTRVPVPLTLDDWLEAVGGDYIQWLGGSGTDFGVPPVALRDWFGDRRLGRNFDPGGGIFSVWKTITRGDRVHPDGDTWLIDYPKDPRGVYRNVFGHAIYTDAMHWPFHLTTLIDDLSSMRRR